MNLTDFEEKCITCLNCDIVEENGNNKTKCDKGGSFGGLNDGCSVNYLKDESAFNTDRIYALLGDSCPLLEEDYNKVS